MKRPPGLWCLLVIATFWLCIQDVNCLRGTALILGKSPSTTTTTTEVPQEIDSHEGVTEAGGGEESQNVTKPTLTGNPQIDYIWDPNLPRELNGYNLSDYPFYHRVPEDINFKCDGLHDGFYASVPHKCQVYHHCLFGIRYDFLCANYTAFDQKTFICHFVSEVDCPNSKKFWHRNDALYKAATTTTTKPTVVYTPPPTAATPIPIAPILNRRPSGGGGGLRSRRPFRRRPQYDYYEDEYEDEEYEERRLRKRPRYRPRPVYEDDYEDYEEEIYSKRRPSRRRPHERRTESRHTKEERRRYEEDEYDEDRETAEDDRRDNKRNDDDSRRKPSNRNRSRPTKRRPLDDEDYERRYERPKKRTRRPIEDEDDYEDEPPTRRPNDRKKNKSRVSENDKDIEDRPKANNKNEEKTTRYNRNEERTRGSDDKPKSKSETKVKSDVITEEPPLTKAPLSVYERKRPPKIRPPVPLNEQSKYAPKSTTSAPLDDEEYYDDYEDEEPVKESKRKPERRPLKDPPKRGFGNKQKTPEFDDEEPVRRTTKRPQGNAKDRRVGSGSRRRPIVEDYDDYEETSTKVTSKDSQITTTKEPIKEKHEPVVKVLKRPFLPSRGGNPYSARGLLPVGLKSIEQPQVEDEPKVESIKVPEENQKTQSFEEVKASKPIFKQRNTFSDEEFRPITNRPVSRINIVKITTTTTTTTTEKPIEKNPLDLDENEYDVTLNDALNPTIPNLPVRNFPTGFSSQNDYNYNTVQRSRYVADPTLNQASSDYVYRIEPLQSRYVPLYQPYRQPPRQQQQAFYGY